MTVLDDRPTNGHAHPELAIPTRSIDEPETVPPSDSPSATEQTELESIRVADLRKRLAERTAEAKLAAQIVKVDGETQADQVRTDGERAKDAVVHQEIRAKERAETRRAGFAAARDQRRQRRQEAWIARAERARLRILDPARALASDHRRWTHSTFLVFALLAGGVAFMSRTVHHGLVGIDGTWLAYAVEPLASVLLVVSLVAQFTAKQRDLAVPRGAVTFDIGLAVASLLLNTIPWGLRFGWDASSLTVHLLTPALVFGAVIVWHLTSRIYGDALATSKEDVSDLTDRLALLRQAVKSGELAVDASATQVIKYLRNNLPGGIGHDAARRVARSFLGY